MENIKPRLFCFGDSFVQWPEPEGEHWTDILAKDFEVHKLGYSGSSNEEIIFQLKNLPEYKKGDRIIMVFTEPSRIPKWYWGEHYDMFLKKQSGESTEENVYVDSLMDLRILKDNLLRSQIADIDNTNPSPINAILFLNTLKTLLKIWKPVFVTWSPSSTYSHVPSIYPILRNRYTTLYEELKGDYDDQHPGIEGNKSWAKILLLKLSEEY